VHFNTISCAGFSLEVPSVLVPIDHWGELLDVSEYFGKPGVAVFRVHGYGLARLIAACIYEQKRLRIVINPSMGTSTDGTSSENPAQLIVLKCTA